MDALKKYVYEAHDIFNETSVFEVLDRDREYAVNFLVSKYGPQMESIEQYLKVLGKLKEYFQCRRSAVAIPSQNEVVSIWDRDT